MGAARRERRLLALRRGRYPVYPGFQFDSAGVRPLIAALLAVAREHGWDETSVIESLVSPTTYLAGQRPVDASEHPDRLLDLARESFGISW